MCRRLVGRNLFIPLSVFGILAVLELKEMLFLFSRVELSLAEHHQLRIESVITFTFIGFLSVFSFFQHHIGRKGGFFEKAPTVVMLPDEAQPSIVAEGISDIIHLTDAEGKILATNQAGFDLLGYKDKETINRPLTEFIHPEHREAIRHDLRQALSGNASPFRAIKLLDKKGREVVAEGRAFVLENGDKLHLGVIIRVARRRKIMRDLGEEAEPLRQVFDFTEEPISIHDVDFTITAANNALVGMLGRDREEIIGRKCFEIFHGDEKQSPPQDCPQMKSMNSKKQEVSLVEMPEPVGMRKVCCKPVLDREGRVIKTIHIFRTLMGEIKIAPPVEIEQICVCCKAMRDKNGDWQSLEEHLLDKGIVLSHGICGDCIETLYKEYV